MEQIAKYTKRLREILIFVAIAWAMRHVAQLDYFQSGEMQNFIQSFGIWAPFAFITVCALSIVAFLPSMLFISLASLMFGKMTGALYALLGITVGACLAFLLGRYSIASFAGKFKNGRLKKIDEWMAKCNEIACMISLRLIFFSNPMVNYASSATQINLRDYVVGTFLGLIPRTIVISYFFELLMRVNSLRDVVMNPLILSFPALRIVGVFLLVALTRSTGREIA